MCMTFSDDTLSKMFLTKANADVWSHRLDFCKTAGLCSIEPLKVMCQSDIIWIWNEPELSLSHMSLRIEPSAYSGDPHCHGDKTMSWHWHPSITMIKHPEHFHHIITHLCGGDKKESTFGVSHSDSIIRPIHWHSNRTNFALWELLLIWSKYKHKWLWKVGLITGLKFLKKSSVK